MRTFMGASTEFHPHELDPNDFEGIRLFHVEGYSFYNEGVVERAMRLAKNAGAKVSLDLSSFEVVRIFKEPIIHCLNTYVDIVLSNEQEVRELSGHHDEEEGCDFLGDICETAIVMMGKRGGWIRHQEQKIRYPAFVVPPIDTTGAGDIFTSGFLHGYLSNYDLKEAARLGAMAASMVVQEIGAVVPKEKLIELVHDD
jgi:sugar/nucleoside kinase (ribokinase family)